MTKLLTAFVFILIITSCHSVKRENKQVRTETLQNVQFDTSIIVLIPYDTTRKWQVFKNSKPTNLISSDIEAIEKRLTHCIDSYNIEGQKRFQAFNNEHPDYKIEKKRFVIDLKRYKRQYIAVTNPNGEKEVWVNCFCTFFDYDWQHKILRARDGGNCFFNLKINLTKGVYYALDVNGEA